LNLVKIPAVERTWRDWGHIISGRRLFFRPQPEGISLWKTIRIPFPSQENKTKVRVAQPRTVSVIGSGGGVCSRPEGARDLLYFFTLPSIFLPIF
jgi:hypothetical protein